MKKKVYFEKLFFYHLPLFFYHILRRHEVIVFDFDRELIKKRWLVRLHDLRLFSFERHSIENHESLALDATEPVYNMKFKDSPMIKAMCGLYESEDASMAYKKELAVKLSVFYSIHTTLKKEDDRIIEGAIILYPYDYDFFLRLVRKSKSRYYETRRLKISSLMSYLSGAHRCMGRLRCYIVFIFVTGILPWGALFKGCLAKRPPEVKKYRYAIPITSFDFQFSFKANRTFDFLLDHKEIRKDNTLFLFTSAADRKKIKEIESRGYNTLQCNGIVNIFKFDVDAAGPGLFKKLLIFWFKGVFLALSQPGFYLVISTKLALIFALWSMILSRFRFEHFIIFNDLGVTHLGRNILLNRYGCRTWSYAYSGTFGFIYANKDVSFYDSRKSRDAFLYYDNYLLWDNSAVSYHKIHPSNKIKNYFNVGCLWSESIMRNENNDARNYLEKIGAGKEFVRGYKVVSFFESTYSNFVPLETGICLYKDIIKLLSDEAGIFVIVKVKKKRSTSDFLYCPSREEYFALSDELNRHPRCYIAGVDKDSSEIVAISDLIISSAFTSVTIEALGARKRSFFYDAGDRRRGFYYDEVPELIVHDYEGLRRRVDQLLFGMSDDEYSAYLNKYILHKVENYLDGKAIARSQRLLAGESPDKVLTAEAATP